MSIRIIEGTDYAVLYCSTSMWAFGPVFEDREEAEAFLEWCNGDPRRWSDADFEYKYSEFRESREKEAEADEPPPALKLQVEREIDGAIRRGKVFGDFLDSMLSPKRT